MTYVEHLVSIAEGIIAGIITYKIINYWSKRTTRRIQRQIEAAKAQITELEYLSKSDKAVFLLGIQSIVVLLGLMAITLAIQASYLSWRTISREGIYVDEFTLWLPVL